MRRTLDRGVIAELRREITGSVLDPDDGRYDAARAVHNGLIDRRPALIVCCQRHTMSWPPLHLRTASAWRCRFEAAAITWPVAQ